MQFTNIIVIYIIQFIYIFFIILVLQKAGRHMEDTLIASYITLIIGYLILEDKVILKYFFKTYFWMNYIYIIIYIFFIILQDRVAQIRELLPEQNFSIMAAVLTKFLQFMKLTASVSKNKIAFSSEIWNQNLPRNNFSL